MTNRFRIVALAGASSLALGTAISAQEAEPIILDTITLTATTDASVQAEGYVGTQAEAATKSDTPVAETQQSVSVITIDQIEDQGAQNLGEALGYTAGVYGQPYGADPRFDSPTIRGFDARGAQYVNGLRQLRHMGAAASETYGMQQIEVLRGPSSSLYGAGMPAGIINQVQKRAQEFDFGEAGLGFDSNGSTQAFVDMNRVVGEQLSLRFTGIGRDMSTQIDELTNKRGYLAGAARWRPDDFTTVDLMASYAKDEPISPTGVPYALTRVGQDGYLRDLYTGEEDWDESDRKMYNFGIEIGHEFQNGWRLSQGFRYEKLDWTYRGTYVSGLSTDGTEILRGANYQKEDTTGFNLDTRLSGEVATGAVTHNILVGLDIRHYEADTTTEFYTGTPLNWRDPVYGTVPTGTAWYVSTPKAKLRQIGIYVQDEIEAGNWRGSLALRQDWSKQTGTTWTNFAGAGEIDQSDNALTGRAGLGYRMDNGVMPYVSYSTSFDPEIGVDENGDILKPTEGRQWEVGLKYEPTDFNGLFTVAIYDLQQKNLTRTVAAGQLRQIGKVKSRGIEFEGTAELVQGWDIRAAYAYNDTEQVGGANDGNEMPNAPGHLASLWLNHDFANGVRVGGGVRYIGSRKGDDANNYDLDPVTLVDLGASYTRDNFEASLNIANLADEDYVANCGSFGCFYGEGRTVAAKVTYKW